MNDAYELNIPDIIVDAAEVFGLSSCSPSMAKVPAYSKTSEYVPEVDRDYLFDSAATLAILAGFIYNYRVMVTGYHGTGKSTHIEQVAARLNWPCVRINLDGHLSRADLIGRDSIVVRNGKQITEFRDGILPWAYQNNIALVLDEYDAGRPEIMFVMQRLLETDSRLVMFDQHRVLRPHPGFRLFATANTIGMGNSSGIYHGTQQLNQAQIDRWSLIAELNYLSFEHELRVVLAKVPSMQDLSNPEIASQMVSLANLTRNAFTIGELSVPMSPRTVITWAKNYELFQDVSYAFCLSFLNRCDDNERYKVAELYQRCFGYELDKMSTKNNTNSLT